MKLDDVVVEARRLLQDSNVPYRYSDAMLLGFANQALKRMAVLRPDLFAFLGQIPTVQNSVLQTMPADSIRIIEVFSVVGGEGIIESNRESLDQAYPSWINDSAAPCVNWMRHPRNANKYFIYPKAPAGQELVAEYAKAPRTYAGDEEVELLPDAYFPSVVDGTLFLASSVDDEHVNSGRAQLFYQSFTQTLGVEIQNRDLTDDEDAGAIPNLRNANARKTVTGGR